MIVAALETCCRVGRGAGMGEVGGTEALGLERQEGRGPEP